MAHFRIDLETIDTVLQIEVEEVEVAFVSLKRHAKGGTAAIHDENIALLQGHPRGHTDIERITVRPGRHSSRYS